ncbi:MAG: glutamate racemase [Candidatus Nomurabacteria bacterium]|jgi:glutamate racemase|nr:glutamate racemase [Candidatus Nomurabacteria bacterium]
MKIGVFDSGIGGLNILNGLQQALPEHDFEYACDTEHVPYGNKSPEEIIRLTTAGVQQLAKDCEVVVIACNTATSYAIDTLRQVYPNTRFVGLEPAIKPASALTESGALAVCATPATLASANYRQLLQAHAKGLTVVEPDCSNWASLIEHGQADQIQLEGLSSELCEKGCDTVVLGCTHYHTLKPKLAKLIPGAAILEPCDAVLKQVKRFL